MYPLVSIVGPTAVGKTDFSLQLIESLKAEGKYQGFDSISADSRQVYKGLEIMSGADIPEGYTQAQLTLDNTVISYLENQDQSTRLFGLSMISPDEEWSVAHFHQFAISILHHSWQQQRLPIVVGGTGLYHQHVLSTDPTLNIKPDWQLRHKAESASVAELQTWLQQVNPQRFDQLNQSDRANPTRLIRSLEISQAHQDEKARSVDQLDFDPKDVNRVTVGLIDSLDTIYSKIHQRVIHRLQTGAIQEVERLIQADPPPTKAVMTTTGVKEVMALLAGEADTESVIEHWSRRELQYVKRQLTWWKKYGNVEWFTVSEPGWKKDALNFVLAHG